MSAFSPALPALTLLSGAAMRVGAVRPEQSPLRAVCRMSGTCLGLTPDVMGEDPRVYPFAQGVGDAFLFVSSAFATLGGLPLLHPSRRSWRGCLLECQDRCLNFRLQNLRPLNR